VSGRIAEAYVAACRAELAALKPGNVHAYADGHRMTVADFEASAEASAPAIAADQPVGQRIHGAIQRTHAATGTNTNLGIVLLCAPLAAAAAMPGPLRENVGSVLSALDVEDAEQAFAAIRLAAPAGLGESSEHDVHEPARVTLLQAMLAARERDRIAWQYATGFGDVFDLGLPRLKQGLARWSELGWATTAAYLGFLSRMPDSHVARKFGIARAEEVRREAAAIDADLMSGAAPAEMSERLLRYDAALKADGVNPGTSADLTVASLFALKLGAGNYAR
jgi:triphosphoribosyl-dephospho-CoA synthase